MGSFLSVILQRIERSSTTCCSRPHVENARLTQIIKELQRHRFGRRAETLPQDQLLLLRKPSRSRPPARKRRTVHSRGAAGPSRQTPDEPRFPACKSAARKGGRRHRRPRLPLL